MFRGKGTDLWDRPAALGRVKEDEVGQASRNLSLFEKAVGVLEDSVGD